MFDLIFTCIGYAFVAAFWIGIFFAGRAAYHAINDARQSCIKASNAIVVPASLNQKGLTRPTAKCMSGSGPAHAEITFPAFFRHWAISRESSNHQAFGRKLRIHRLLRALEHSTFA